MDLPNLKFYSCFDLQAKFVSARHTEIEFTRTFLMKIWESGSDLNIMIFIMI